MQYSSVLVVCFLVLAFLFGGFALYKKKGPPPATGQRLIMAGWALPGLIFVVCWGVLGVDGLTALFFGMIPGTMCGWLGVWLEDGGSRPVVMGLVSLSIWLSLWFYSIFD